MKSVFVLVSHFLSFHLHLLSSLARHISICGISITFCLSGFDGLYNQKKLIYPKKFKFEHLAVYSKLSDVSFSSCLSADT